MNKFESGIQVGPDSAGQILNIVHGSVTMDLPSVNANAVASASATVYGLRFGMKVFVAFTNQELPIASMGGQCLADDILTLWLSNPGTASKDAGSAVAVGYLGLR